MSRTCVLPSRLPPLVISDLNDVHDLDNGRISRRRVWTICLNCSTASSAGRPAGTSRGPAGDKATSFWKRCTLPRRGLAKDFEATIASAKAWVYIASVQLLLRRLA